MPDVDRDAVFEWTQAYSVGIPAMDREHRLFFGLVESLNRAMREGQGRAMLRGLLAELLRYSREHFSHEETLMAGARFPELAEHRGEHAGLAAALQQFQQRFARGETTMTIELLQFLMYWLRAHITTSDHRFGEFLASRLTVSGSTK